MTLDKKSLEKKKLSKYRFAIAKRFDRYCFVYCFMYNDYYDKYINTYVNKYIILVVDSQIFIICSTD